MDCQKAKTVSLIFILDRIGAYKIRETGADTWYLSPFREEKSASFKVNIQKNIFYDFGEGIGGNALDFVMHYYNCNVADALDIMKRNFQSLSFHQPSIEAIQSEKAYKILSVSKLSHPSLIQYLHSRGLNVEICMRYLSEVHYQLNSKKYFAIGFRNDKNGFELRNKYIKLCLGNKWFTHISNNTNSVIIFESWSDFVSMLILHPDIDKKNDFIVLNSLAMLVKTDSVLTQYKNVFLALDHDPAGTKATETCMIKWKNKCVDLRCFYPHAKDINEFLIHKMTVL